MINRWMIIADKIVNGLIIFLIISSLIYTVPYTWCDGLLRLLFRSVIRVQVPTILRSWWQLSAPYSTGAWNTLAYRKSTVVSFPCLCCRMSAMFCLASSVLSPVPTSCLSSIWPLRLMMPRIRCASISWTVMVISVWGWMDCWDYSVALLLPLHAWVAMPSTGRQ